MSAATGSEIADIELQVAWTRLVAIVEEQAQTLLRTAFSPVVRESGDLSAGIFDRRGRMLAQAMTGTPGHINTMASAVGCFLEVFPASTMREGDVYVTNDPWHGTGHLNDYVVVTPAFARGRLIAIFACTGHMTDVGGIGLSPEGRDIFMEGVTVPISKLFEEGRRNDTLMRIALANSRMPFQLEGDLYSLVASNAKGIEGLHAMLEESGREEIDEVADHIIRTSERAARDCIARCPDGEASYAMTVDGYEEPIELRARLRIAGDRISLDWSETTQASRFGINVPFNYAAAYASYALACALAPEVPNNAGTLSVFEMQAKVGSVLHAVRPQPVALRHIVGQLLPDVIFGCLDQVMPGRLPAESASALWTLTIRGGVDGNAYAISIVTNGGTGARPALDGLSATSFPSAVRGSPVEVIEATTPLVFWRRELRRGSGGRGRRRGGDGQEMEISARNGTPFTLYAAFDRAVFPARGRQGGQAGALGELQRSDGERLPGKGAHEIAPGMRLVVRTPGGGGYGPG